MEVVYASIPLTGPTVYEQTGPVAFPVSRLVNLVPGVAAESLYIQVLGNRGLQVSFSCWRSYPTLLDAMHARGSFIASLPKTGTLTLTQDSLGRTLVQSGQAALQSTPEPILLGRAVQFTFAFAVASLTSVITDGDILRDSSGDIVTDHNNTPVYN